MEHLHLHGSVKDTETERQVILLSQSVMATQLHSTIVILKRTMILLLTLQITVTPPHRI